MAPIPGVGEPGPDGFVNFPVANYVGVFIITITFPNPPTELSTVKVRPPTDSSLRGDHVTVFATYTDEDGKAQTKVTFIGFIFLQRYYTKVTTVVYFTHHSIFSSAKRVLLT